MEFSLVYFSQKKFKFSAAATCEIFFFLDVLMCSFLSLHTPKCRLKLGGFKSKLGSFERVEKTFWMLQQLLFCYRIFLEKTLEWCVIVCHLSSIFISRKTGLFLWWCLLPDRWWKYFSREEIRLISRLQAIFAPPLNTEKAVGQTNWNKLIPLTGQIVVVKLP